MCGRGPLPAENVLSGADAWRTQACTPTPAGTWCHSSFLLSPGTPSLPFPSSWSIPRPLLSRDASLSFWWTLGRNGPTPSASCSGLSGYQTSAQNGSHQKTSLSSTPQPPSVATGWQIPAFWHLFSQWEHACWPTFLKSSSGSSDSGSGLFSH